MFFLKLELKKIEDLKTHLADGERMRELDGALRNGVILGAHGAENLGNVTERRKTVEHRRLRAAEPHQSRSDRLQMLPLQHARLIVNTDQLFRFKFPLTFGEA